MKTQYLQLSPSIDSLSISAAMKILVAKIARIINKF
jgi:hypothetical protein